MGIAGEKTALSRPQTQLMLKLLFIARKCISLKWIDNKPPTIHQWYIETFIILPLERLSVALRCNEVAFYHVWSLYSHSPT